MLSGSVSQNNVLGTGNSLTAALNTSKVNQHDRADLRRALLDAGRRVALARDLRPQRQPFVAADRAVSVADRAARRSASAFRSRKPISINRRRALRAHTSDAVRRQPAAVPEFVKEFGAITNSSFCSAGWSRDTRDNILFPDARAAAKRIRRAWRAGDLLYYKLNYLIQWFTPMPLGSGAHAALPTSGYGGGLGDKPLPFFKAYYAGGVGSVRGYETASLGPQDVAGNTIGGRQKIVGNVELFFPVPGHQSWGSVGADVGIFRRGPDLRQRLRAESRVVPVFDWRRPCVEFAGRAAQVQLWLSAERRSRTIASSTSSSR